jgi:mRNA-degrading endonuclease YafQ of YafQ-DinJ toxin-antitoxin module
MQLIKTSQYERNEKKFFKQHKDLFVRYAEVLKQLQIDPFHSSLRIHKLKGDLSKYHSCSLTYEYRIVLILKIVDEEIILVNIGSHDEVY